MKRLLFIALAAVTLAGGIAYAATGAKPRRSFVIATPKPGKINIAVLRFDVKRGAKPPRLHISARYKPPAKAAVVTAVLHVRGKPNRYLGLVAIVNFRAAKYASAARDDASASVTTDNYEFVLEANGAAAPLGGEWLGGSSVHRDFVHVPAIPPSQAASYSKTVSGLIDRIVKILRGAPDLTFSRAVAGDTQPPPLGDFILEISANHFHNGPGDSTLFGCARTSPAQPGASYTDTITKPDKSTASRTGVLDSAGKATISTPINQYGDYTQALAVTSGGKTVTKTVTSSVTSAQGQSGCA